MPDDRELFCILVPLARGKLILPRSVVEEVRSMSDLKAVDNAPPWIAGRVRWRADTIPLVAVEPLLEMEIKQRSRRSRMVVVRTPADTLDPGFMAILAQGFPYILRVTPQLLQRGEELENESDEALLTRVSLGLERPVIPDLPALAGEAARLLAA